MDSNSIIPENSVDTPKSQAGIGQMLEHVGRKHEIELCRGESVGGCFCVAWPNMDPLTSAVQKERDVPIRHDQPVHIGLEERALVTVTSAQLERGRKRVWRAPAEDHLGLAIADPVKVRVPVHQATRLRDFLAARTITCQRASRQEPASWRTGRSGPRAAF